MPRTATEVVSQEFLQTRAKILELAAFFDRLNQPLQGPAEQRQVTLLQQACEILNDDSPDKAARVQLLFSRQYQPSWREEFGI